MPTHITPVKLANKVATLYSSKIDYPPITPWDSGVGATPNFTPSFGNAYVDARLSRVGVTFSFDGYFYALQNDSYVRCLFNVTNTLSTTNNFGVFRDETSGKLVTGFYTVAANMITAQIFESDVVVPLDGGDMGTITFSEVFNGTYDPTFSAPHGTFTEVWLIVLPQGGSFSYGIGFYYQAVFPPSPGFDYGVVSFFDIATTTLYCIASNYVAGGSLPKLQSYTACVYAGSNTYRAMLYSSGSFDSGPVLATFGFTTDPTLPIWTPIFLDFSLGDIFQFSLGQYWYRDGFWYAMDTSGGASFYEIANDATSYSMVTFVGGDNDAQNFINSFAYGGNKNWGYSLSGKTALFVAGTSAAPLIFTFQPVIQLSLMGLGPILPILNLACQNFCLPMYRMRRV